ncbi:MAG: glycosyltransferase [Flavobacteriales bacterium]|nr:glycosyltransferase [Flavobacteriales bacterium]
MSTRTSNSTPPAGAADGFHVLFLPKWWPNDDDPQLGDFLRKQAQAVASQTRTSVLYVHADKHPNAQAHVTTSLEQRLYEVRSHYVASVHAFGPWRRLVNFRRYWCAAKSGWEQLITERGLPHLTHVHILVRPALFALRLKQRHGIPYLISEQSSEYLDGTYAGKGPLFKALNRFLFRRAAGITAVSAWLGDALVRLGLCKTYGVVPNVVPGLDRPLPPPGPAGHLLVVADLVDRTKNVSGVLRALAVARKSDPRLHLTVIGDGPDRRMLEALAREQGVAASVRFLGRMPNSGVLDHMAGAGAVIINSNVETFSVVTGEALAQGKPVIATRCGGPIAFITPENGILIPVGDEAALAAAMRQWADDTGRYAPEAIRRSVNARSSSEAVGRAFMEYYRSILLHA